MKKNTFKGFLHTNSQNSYYDMLKGKNSDGHDSGYYFLSNDVTSISKRNIKTDLDANVIVGIANPHFFHVISLISRDKLPKRIIGVDNNLQQLLHFERIINIILTSSNRIEFLQNLFKVKFNSTAIELLEKFKGFNENYIHGGVEHDQLYALECALWKNLEFNVSNFKAEYNLEVQKRDDGLLISSKTIGEINEYYATFLCCSKENYKSWPFTIAFGCGFLHSEASFLRLQKILKNAETYLILEDISNIYETILFSNRYFPIFFWSSNLLVKYFLNKHPPLRKIIEISTKLGTSKILPEVDVKIIYDEREKISLPKEIDIKRSYKRNLSIHTKSFNKVSKYLEGDSIIEVVKVSDWIEQDNYVSKLYKADYIYIDEFREMNKKVFDTIFLHILMGHGMNMDDFAFIAKKAFSQTRNLIILEHNKNSRDFKGKIGATKEEIRNILGKESYMEYCPGEKSKDRNILMVYKTPNCN